MNKKYPVALWTLVIGAFAIGMTEFVIMGLLPEVARDVHSSIAAAGQLITGYALGVAVGGPILVLITYKMSQKNLLMLLMLIFILGNLMATIASSYGVLMASRLLTSLAHGSFFGVGAIMAASLVEYSRRASAMALMFTGLTVANIIGVPFGTFVGQQFGWRSSFLIIAIIGFITLIGIYMLVPKPKEQKSTDLKKELAVLKNNQLWLALLIAMFCFGSVFTLFTYITPILTDVTGFQSNAVSWMLVVFGLGVTVGNILGGKLADWNINLSLQYILVVFILYFFVLYVLQFSMILMIPGIFIFGVLAFSMVPMLQFRILGLSAEAPTIASTLNQSAMNLGNAGGAFAGGLSVTYLPLHDLVLVAPIITVIGFILLFVQMRGVKAKAA
ncbi:MFS transporter [Niallia taxi]|uniref:MFS transporter n=1 Tax=Niallia taxi TaxID=2499688 RepID=A0A3S2TXT7_9BACI|nr:MFS transporter [Niallia taxi]MDK8640256.1 MFS transporter [Niallia taxi]RVT63807.1 MFS transporter [Niallia taxi]